MYYALHHRNGKLKFMDIMGSITTRFTSANLVGALKLLNPIVLSKNLAYTEHAAIPKNSFSVFPH